MTAAAKSSRLSMSLWLLTIMPFVLTPAIHANESQLATGEALYSEFCVNCHGADKSGLDDYTDDLAALTDRLEGITEEMPDFAGFFEADEIAAIHAYLAAPAATGS
jgi:mono/diheme cytochrome c family protein